MSGRMGSDSAATRAQPADLTIGSYDAVIDIVCVAAFDCMLDRVRPHFAVVGMDKILENLRVLPVQFCRAHKLGAGYLERLIFPATRSHDQVPIPASSRVRRSSLSPCPMMPA